MALPVSVIVTRARYTLLDPGTGPAAPAWTDSELIDYAAAAQTAVCQIKPDAYLLFTPIPLVPGAQQTLPAQGTELIGILSNAADGSTIRIIDRETLDHSYPNWQSASGATALVRRYYYDKRNPKQFWVTPASVGNVNVNAVYSAVPPRPLVLSDLLSVDDTYETALWAFVVGSAYFKNSARYDATKGSSFMAQFAQMVGARTTAQGALVPNPQE